MTTLRDLQLAEFEILKEVVKICNHYKLQYFLCAGTLLGAVRHKGFIPWDDDIDIAMPIEDFNKFNLIAQNELGDKYFVQNYMTERNYCDCYTKVRKNDSTLLDEYHDSYNINHGLWIDIFPLISINIKYLAVYKKILSLSNFIQAKNKIEANKEEFKKILSLPGYYAVKLFGILPIKIRQYLHKKILDIVFYSSKTSENCTIVWSNITTIYPKTIFQKYILINFESENFFVPYKYKEFLTIQYGDYLQLPPIEKRKGHAKKMIIDLDHSYKKYMKL